MSCPKCGGKLIPEKMYLDQGVFDGLRCIMCGDVVDELILEHRIFGRRKKFLCNSEEMIFSDQSLVTGVIQKMQK